LDLNFNTMKKVSVILLGAGVFVFSSCDLRGRDNNTTTTQDNERVVHRDSIPTQYEVRETTVQYDTTVRTRTVDVDRDNNRNNERTENRRR
jgi:hypothetical protein